MGGKKAGVVGAEAVRGTAVDLPAGDARRQRRGPAPCFSSTGRWEALFPRRDFGDKAARWQAEDTLSNQQPPPASP